MKKKTALRPAILNRAFQHPTDGWYQIETPGNHPNAEAGVVQVIDDAAVTSIVNRFNREADAYEAQHGVPFPGMLIDHEHFKHQTDKETVAYGWLMRLDNRQGKPFGQIHWTTTGKPAVDGGDYRFFSTEYDPKQVQILNTTGKVKRVRPLRLDGLTLTNDPNNQPAKPITNRGGNDQSLDDEIDQAPDDGLCPECEEPLAADAANPDVMTCPGCHKNYANAGASAANQHKTTKKNKMKNIASKLGLAAEASEEAIVAAVTKIMNRNAELEPLAETNKTLTNRLTALEGEQIDSLLTECKVTDAKIINRVKPALAPLANREERLKYLADFGYKPGEAKRVLNRGSGTAPDETTPAAGDEQARVEKIRNRCSELQKSGLKFDAAWAKAVSEAGTAAA